MPHQPQVVAFDVIETLFSLETMRPRFQHLGLPATALELWYSQTLRDAFALSVAGGYTTFEQLSTGALQVLCVAHGIVASEADIQEALAGMKQLGAHSDVQAGFEVLRQAGIPIVALSNGGQSQTKHLLQEAGLADLVSQVLSCDEVQRFKPFREVYEYAAREIGVAPGQMALVAAHAWDVQGAKAAGFTGGWIPRRETRYQPALPGPDVSGQTLSEVCQALLQLPA